MKQEISLNGFMDEFRDSQYKNNFSYDGLHSLYDYLTDLEEDTGTDIDFDLVAICCDYREYQDIKEFLNDYPDTVGIDKKDYEDDDDLEGYEEDFLNELQNHTTVIRLDDHKGFIIQYF